jgi:hypothetical protein
MQRFFDKSPFRQLKAKVSSAFGRKSLRRSMIALPVSSDEIICAIIDAEIY